MIRVLHLDQPEDFVFATGKLTSVRQFLATAANKAGFSPRFEGEGKCEVCFDSSSGAILARVSEQYFRPFDTSGRRGNSAKLTARINWKGSKSIDAIAGEMICADIERWKCGIRNI
jgi:GDPmannose 4,6-dehydratase